MMKVPRKQFLGTMIVTVLALVAAMLSVVGLPPTSSLAIGAIRVAPIIPSQDDGLPPNTRTYTIFYDNTISFNYQAGDFVTLYTCTDDSCSALANTIVADDAIKLSVAETQRQVELDFYAQDFPPADVTPLFAPGNNTLRVQLIDLLGPRFGSPRPFVLVSSQTPPPVPTLRIEPAPFGTQFNAPFLFSFTSRDPVQTFTGSYTYAHTDLSIPGRGPSPLFVRAYNSNDTRTGPLGQGWTHSYNIHLASPSPGSSDVILDGPQGRSDLYTSNGDGTYTPPPAVYTTLVKNPDGTYTATQKDQTVWTFHADGRLLRIEDRYGNISLLGYDADSKLTSVSDPAGRGSLTLAYNANGRLTSVTDWATPPRTVLYGYDASGRLISATDREGNATTYAYDGSSQCLTSITDSNGHAAVTQTYDAQGRVSTQKDARGLITGEQTTFTYNSNPDGFQTTIVIYPTTSFDSTWHHIEEDTYDSQGRITRHVSKPTSNPSEWATEEYTYDASSNRNSQRDGRGNTTLLCYDIGYNGAPLPVGPGNRGNLTRRIEPPPAPGANRPVTLFQYDAKNNLVETIPPKGVSSGQSVSCSTDLSGSINSIYATDMIYDGATHTLLLSVTRRYTDPELGVQTAVTKYEYTDPNNPGSVTKMIPPRGNTGPTPDYTYATTYTYFQPGGGTSSKAGMLQQDTKPLSIITTYDYDVVGRRTSMVDPNGNAPGGVPADHTWRYAYDKEDRLRFQIAPAPQSGGTPLTMELRYDAVGNKVVSLDPNGQVTKNLYDERDGLKEVHESPSVWTDPNIEPSDTIVTQYLYDNLGNLVRTTRAKGNPTYERVVDYSYDGLNRLRKETQYPNWPNTGGTLVTLYTYDLNGNKQTLRDPLGQTTTFGYDALNQMTAESYSDGLTPNVLYTYDANGNRTSMSDGTGTTTYSYDERDLLLSVTSPGDRGPNTVSYRYDLDTNRTKLTYPDGTSVRYTFDKADRLSSLLDWANLMTSYTYLPDGNVRTITSVNGTIAQYSYDNAQRLTEVWNQEGTNTISKHTYTLDAAGIRTRVDEVLPQNGVVRPIDPSRQATTLYSYDRLYRLTGESGLPGTIGYSYDLVGNRLSRTQDGSTTLYSYDRADRITRVGTANVTVDANGNMVARGRETYQYDQANRMIRVRMPQPSQYIYNGDGLRVKTDAGQGPLDTQVYDVGRSLPVLLYDGRRKYVYGVGSAGEGLVYATDGNGGLEVYHVDGLGSVRAVTYMNGNVVQNYQTDAFGVVVKRQGTSNQPFQYAGEQRDKETEFYYLRARYYDPSMGRFISRDPMAGLLSTPLSLNRFAYAQGNPLSRVDPSGLASSRVLQFLGLDYQVAGASASLRFYPRSALGGALYLGGLAVAGGVILTVAFPEILVPAEAIGATTIGGGNVVYQTIVNNSVGYVGITNDFARRSVEQLAERNIQIEPIPGLTDLSRFAARAAEQVLIERYGLQNLMNQINSISTSNPVYQEAVRLGNELLQNIGR